MKLTIDTDEIARIINMADVGERGEFGSGQRCAQSDIADGLANYLNTIDDTAVRLGKYTIIKNDFNPEKFKKLCGV